MEGESLMFSFLEKQKPRICPRVLFYGLNLRPQTNLSRMENVTTVEIIEPGPLKSPTINVITNITLSSLIQP